MTNQTGASGEARGVFGAIGKIVFWPLSILYVLVVVGVFYLGYAQQLRKEGIFACSAGGYGGDHYLALCDKAAYGDYDHGAVWYGLEPRVVENAKKADLLFIGSSRSQFGFSAPAVGRWFAENDLHYYLLGFSHFETSGFIGPVLKKIRPQARAYVINVDGFFNATPSPPGGDVMNGSRTLLRYEIKQYSQTIQQMVCGRVPKICGDGYAFWRQRDTGEWKVTSDSLGSNPIGATDAPVDAKLVESQVSVGKQFIADLGVEPSCVILTYVPQTTNDRATAAAVASALGYTFVSPRVEGLTTFDGSHLDADSAQKFSAAFFAEAGPQLQKCFGRTSTVSTTTFPAQAAAQPATPAATPQ
jgi:hypothetical protein